MSELDLDAIVASGASVATTTIFELKALRLAREDSDG